MPGVLYIVATPIGNLEDVTLRALRVLRQVDLVAAEDTRRTTKLLNHYGISTRLTSLHAHNEHTKTRRLVAELVAGCSIALVSDAGTPAISDPGADLVVEAVSAGVSVVPIPGPSAVLAAVSAAGVKEPGFTFLGFPPTRSKDRLMWFQQVGASVVPVVFFEAPHRIRRTLSELQLNCGERPIMVARELTKLHETLTRGRIADALKALDESLSESKGEFTAIIWPSDQKTASQPLGAEPSDEAIQDLFGQLTDNGGSSRRDAIKAVALKFGLRAKDVYTRLERVKSRSND